MITPIDPDASEWIVWVARVKLGVKNAFLEQRINPFQKYISSLMETVILKSI